MPSGMIPVSGATAGMQSVGAGSAGGNLSSGSTGASGGPNFRDQLAAALKEVNSLQLAADQAAQRLLTGEASDVAGVMITTQKATLALRLTTEVRNKVIEAYQEVMRMQV